MKKTLSMIGAAIILCSLSVSSFAVNPHTNNQPQNTPPPGNGKTCAVAHQNCGKNPAHVPEIDAAGAGIVIALLGGFVSIAREHRKRKQ